MSNNKTTVRDLGGIKFRVTDINEAKPKSKKEKKLHYSKWLILLNSNLQESPDITINELGSFLKTELTEVIANPKSYRFKDKNKKAQFNSEFIEMMDTKITAEIGKKQKRIHVHALLYIEHYSVLQLDFKEMRILLDEKILNKHGLSNYFLRIVWIPNDRPVEDYLKKEPIPSPIAEWDQNIISDFSKMAIRRKKNK